MEHLTWQRVGHNGESAGIEVAFTNAVVYVRNVGQAERPFAFSIDEWRAFVRGVKSGAFDNVADRLNH